MSHIIEMNLEQAIRRAAGDTQWEDISHILEGLPVTKPEGPWIAGGFLRRALANENPLGSDVDYFFASQEQIDEMQSAMREGVGLEPVHENERQTTFHFPQENDSPVTIQLVTLRTYENLRDVIDSFDFTVAMFGTDGERLLMDEWSLWDLARKRLVVNQITYAMASVRRMMKYQKQGYYTCPGAITDLLEAVAEHPAIINSEVHYVD